MIPIYEAEVAKINHTRKQDGLEEMQEMPLARVTSQRLCRRCRGPADYRCRTCWSFYCSSECKKRDAAAHVFTCRMPNRPNDVDFLRLVIRKVSREVKSEDEERMHNAFTYLFSDDHICRTFGFNNCADRLQVLNLICLYGTLFARVRPAVRALHEELEASTLVQFMLTFCKLERDIASLRNTKECSCVSWFLGWSPDTFPVPNMDQEQYDIWIAAASSAFASLNVDQLFKAEYQFSRSQRDVLDLYIAIQPTLWRLPDATTSTWIKFGFCHCRSFSQRVQLAKHYLSLATSGATFDDIVAAYEALRIPELMHARGLDISKLESQGVVPRRPGPCEYSVFRLMISVEHALSGRFCDCFRVHEQRECHRPFETHLEREGDLNFGFHLTSSWEKWQLLNFYKYIFRQRSFDARRMARAVDDADRDSLEAYLESLDPGMRKRLHLAAAPLSQ
ncbi:hypothetical protein ISF_00225 [Cordyceps fumosorosea ARSEF 2679]|uniref:Suppressor of anucleate metulae protein B n=1 Tax=Cordyceps fumosorosea (strain ARSEF 2679) TaxID=1081104 RepID=A0A162LNJ3_CORFA|nr:hypothetical protein ISF_00225 [Cordyceps fumosorosea ARSEF 2679]OAA73324.1 hypothetical protein ISF_00225 [Cordyceps fumosorosea ARSEF 2679]